MFDAYYDVEEKMKKGNLHAKKARAAKTTLIVTSDHVAI